MEAFLGKWELERSQGLADLLRHMRVREDLLKIADTSKNTIEILDLHNGEYKFHCENEVKGSDDVFRLGQAFQEGTPDGRTVTSTVTVENGVMKHVQVGDGQTVTIHRSIVDGQMKTVVNFDGHSCERWYRKV